VISAPAASASRSQRAPALRRESDEIAQREQAEDPREPQAGGRQGAEGDAGEQRDQGRQSQRDAQAAGTRQHQSRCAANSASGGAHGEQARGGIEQGRHRHGQQDQLGLDAHQKERGRQGQRQGPEGRRTFGGHGVHGGKSLGS